MNYGYVKVAAAVPCIKVADCKWNAEAIEKLIVSAESRGAQIVVFPELVLTGSTCGDLFMQPLLLEEAENGLKQLLSRTSQLDIIYIIGMPVATTRALLNVAVVCQKGKILGVVPKTYLADTHEHADKRWFASAALLQEQSIRICGEEVPVGANLLFDTADVTFAVEIGADLNAPVSHSSALALQGAEIICNLSADCEVLGRYEYLRALVANQSSRTHCGYVYASAGFGESTTDLVFAGNALIYENGKMLAEANRFSMEGQLVVSDIDVEWLRSERKGNNLFVDGLLQLNESDARHLSTAIVQEKPFELSRTYEAHPFVPQGTQLDAHCEEIFAIQTTGLAQRLLHTHTKSVVIGISGGLDSTLALLVCVKTYDRLGWDRKNIIGVTMPGFGTTDRTYTNALQLMQTLGITIKEISIKKACLQHFEDIGHDAAVHDVVYENSQARERTQLLMDIANQTWGMVVGTGDLSELALGWATYNGDHMSMYSVNGGVPKTLVKHLVKWVAEHDVDETARITLLDIVDTPISPELIPADEQGNIKQKTEDLVGPYELHDFFLYHFMRCAFRPAKIYFLALRTFKGVYDEATIKKWLQNFFRRFFNQQFKRSCLPDGPKVGSVGISPRGDWRMPSDASSAIWLAEVEKL